MGFHARWASDVLRREGTLVHLAAGPVPDPEWEGASIDSRRPCRDRLFFALVGRRDGHAYLEAAVGAGATGLVVSRPRAQVEALARARGVTVLGVTDTRAALQQLGRLRLDAVGPRRTAVTGTNGKTTTKDYVKSVLARTWRVAGTQGNYNNELGVPLTLLSLRGDEDWIVLEFGATAAGDIDRLASWTRPEIGIITNIGVGHLESFGSLDEIAHVKGELLDRISPEGLAVLPADDRFLVPLRKRSQAPILTFGFREGADLRVEEAESTAEGTRCRIDGHALRLKKWGRHNALNAAAAMAVARHLGVPPRETIRALEEADGTAGRSRLLRLGEITLVDDTYNANPASMAEALSALAGMKVEGRRWALLGDMLELGVESPALHRRVGGVAARHGLDYLLGLGDHAREYCEGAGSIEGAGIVCEAFEEADPLARRVASELSDGDVVLVKGSRGSAMERVLEAVVKNLGGGPTPCSTS